jgi:hypothetical protein
MVGKIAQVTDNVVHLFNLTGAEYFDAFVDVKDISVVVVRAAGRQQFYTSDPEASIFAMRKRCAGNRAWSTRLQDCQPLVQSLILIT